MKFGTFNMIAASDFLCNIYVFKDGKIFKTYLNAHSKLISDLTWIFSFDQPPFQAPSDAALSQLPSNATPTPYLVSCSFDARIKLWSLND